jgi:hypothetical protein
MARCRCAGLRSACSSATSAHRKTALLERLLEQFERPSVLVFTRTRRGARRLARALHDAGHDSFWNGITISRDTKDRRDTADIVAVRPWKDHPVRGRIEA